MKKSIQIVDTTLRDGEQRPGIALTVEDKITIAKLLDNIGVCEIEAGTPSVAVEGIEYYHQLKEEISNAKISVWSRTNIEDIKNAILCKPDIIHIGMPISYAQIYSKLHKNKVWVYKRISECMEIIQSENIEVTVGFEDASRADEGFMIEVAKLVKENAGDKIRIADTVGVLTPQRAENIVTRILEKVDIPIEFHGHNDLGMAVANSITSAKAGANYIDCTILGIGERSGNCDLRSFVDATSRIFELEINKKELHNVENILKKILEDQSD